MATTVRVTETFDMKTTVNKLGIIGIHTPTGEEIRRLYPGLVKNHRFVRILSCDVVGACASVLPADPLQVGVTAGDIAPEDMFNPILMKAVSNESYDTIVSKAYASSDVATLGSVNKVEPLNGDNAFNVYYTMLASKGWRKAMPQAGFSLRGLVPLAHTLVSTFGNTHQPGNEYVLQQVDDETTREIEVPDVTTVASWTDGSNYVLNRASAITFRGKAVRMPKFSCHMFGPENYTDIPNLNIMKTFVACLIMPPARLNEFYYRMRVTWTIRFENVIPSTEVASGGALVSMSPYTYGKDYTYVSSKVELPDSVSTVDSDGVDINKVM